MDDRPDLTLEILRAAGKHTAVEHLEVGLRADIRIKIRTQSKQQNKPLSVNQNVTVVCGTPMFG